MTHLKFEVTRQNFKAFRSIRIQQGEVSAGPEAQGTILRSCICVGFFEPEKRIGAISHITGFREDGLHSAPGALKTLEKKLSRLGVALTDCECFVVGGADSSRHVYDGTCAELRRLKLPYEELDILGSFHRKILLDPVEGVLKLFKKSGPIDAPRAETAPSPSERETAFHDPKARVTTGASTFFRNRALLDFIRAGGLEEMVSRTQRLHVWCAGCSVGVEVYSAAMVILEWLSTQNEPVDLRILGTDISQEALEQAEAGEYAVTRRMTSAYGGLLGKYAEFVSPNRVRIGPEVRDATLFKIRDIREGSRGHRFEFVICDHVLQYFPVDEQEAFVAKLVDALLPGGYLYASTPSMEIRKAMASQYRLEAIQRHLYRKRG